MTWWIGSQAAIDAAERAATVIVRALPAYRDGVEVPNETTRWAIPAQAADGRWVILARDDMDVPEGCAAVDAVDWPEVVGGE